MSGANSFQRPTLSVNQSPDGWIVTRWGTDSDGLPSVRRARVAFETSGIEAGSNLYGRYNRFWICGDYIAELAELTIVGVRVLRNGCVEYPGVRS